MKPLRLRMTTMAVAFITGASALVLGGAAPAQASCGSLTDKSIAGTLSGDDGRAVNAMVGFTYVDEFGYRLDVRGCRLSGDAYGRVFHLNAGVPETGTAPTSATSDRFFIGNIPSAVKEVWVETYPKTPGGATSYRRYAGVYQPAVAPGRMNLNLRLPLTCAAGGRTGAIVASVFIGGRQVTPTWMGYWSETASSKQMGYALSGGAPGGFVSPPLSSSPGANGRPQTYEVAIFYKGTTYWRHGLPVYACKTTHVRIDE